MKHTPSKGDLRPAPALQKVGQSKKKTPKRYLNRPDLGLMDRLLRSFNQVAHEDWIPSQYLQLLRNGPQARKTLH
ncbi:MAG: hypothetical protein K8R69_06865 [Deltaproteobacteria bacterium]|nr:hypothetical protein [Deltaproteobacteria bacterium]